MSECISDDCRDKKSTHYFMSHMTQEEWERLINEQFIDKVPQFKFNLCRKWWYDRVNSKTEIHKEDPNS